MGQASTIERLPPDILEQLQALLRDPRVTQLEATAQINAVLAREGHPERVSKSAVNRYSVRMEEVGKRLRESREMAQMWISKLGAAPQGELGHLVNEILRTLAFDLSLSLQDGAAMAAGDPEAMAGTIDMLKELSLSVQRLEAAASLNVKRETEIKRRAREEALAAVADKVEADGGPVTAERLRAIMRETYGV